MKEIIFGVKIVNLDIRGFGDKEVFEVLDVGIWLGGYWIKYFIVFWLVFV